MLQYLQFPLPDDAVGTAVKVTGGILKGRRGVIDTLPDDPQSAYVLVELDGNGSRVWIEVAHLEETPNAELYADRPEVMRALDSLAGQAMRGAREAADGEHIIGRTRRGAVALRYDPRARLYTVTRQDGGSWASSGSAAAVRVELINLFDVREGEGRAAAA